MSCKKTMVRYELNTYGVKSLSDGEINAILRAADELIATGGRSMLARILKGSRDKKLLEHKLNQCPVYAYYDELKLQEITNRIDWMIMNGYLDIQYSGKLPMIVFTDKGWEIERETYAEELLQKLSSLLDGKEYSFTSELKDRNRGMIFLLLEKIRLDGNARFIPLLKEWKTIEYKKVQDKIQNVIDYLMKQGTLF